MESELTHAKLFFLAADLDAGHLPLLAGALPRERFALTVGVLGRAATSPITIGIVCGLVVGKLVGIIGASWLATRRRLGNFPLTVPWTSVIGVATVAGIGGRWAARAADAGLVALGGVPC